MLGLLMPRAGLRSTSIALVVGILTACGGGESDSTPSNTSQQTTSSLGDQSAVGAQESTTKTSDPSGTTASSIAGTTATAQSANVNVLASTTTDDASRLLTEGTFGPTAADVASVASTGAAAWVDAQLAKPVTTGYLARWDADNAAAQRATPPGTADSNSVTSQFFYQALNSSDQLRQRVAFALSQIMVVSMSNWSAAGTRTIASYMDMLNRDAFGNYRTLLQDVSLHPAMGQYLSSVMNAKENPTTGQIPDQNYAREVMQLMSIGLVQLNQNGTKKLVNGFQVETYTPDDIVGMSKVFSGWSWAGPDTSTDRFWGHAGFQDANRGINPMQGYPQWHSTSQKNFLGTVVAPQQTPDPAASLKAALDTLYNHPNVGPFIGRQLIQRLVRSHPSNAYVGRVAAVFANNGSGVRGDMKAVVRAILLDSEARAVSSPGPAYGKVREPILRLTGWMRAFNAKSDSGKALMWATGDYSRLAQSPLWASSVFNFYRPGYVAPNSETGAHNLTMPELQITNEATVAGYINYMTTVVTNGVGPAGPTNTGTRPDIQPDYSAEMSLAYQTTDLIDDVTHKLIGYAVSDSLKAQIATAVNSFATPVPAADGSNAAYVSWAKTSRVHTAILLTLVSPEFIVQK